MNAHPIHVAIFLPALEGGGSEHVALLLAESLANYGHRVDIVVGKRSGALRDAVPHNVRLVDLQCKRSIFAVKPLLSYIEANKPDVVLSVINHANVIATSAVRMSRHKPFMFPRVGFPISRNTTRGLREWLAVLLAKWTYRWADQVVCVSNDVALDTIDVLGLQSSRVRTIYNPVIRPELQDKANEEIDHPWFAPDREDPVLISVGRLSAMKDFQLLIRAFAKVRHTKPCKLVLLGEGDERLNLEATVRELELEAHVWMPGFVENPYAYVSRADLFVMSSRGEGLPNALLEAVALKIPAISTDCLAGPREVLDNGRLGELVEVGNEESLVEAILRVIRDGRRIIASDQDLEPYTIEACTESYLAMFDEYLSSRGRGTLVSQRR